MNEMKLPGFICIVAQAFYRCQESCSIVLESLKYLVAHLVFLSRREYHMLLWERWPSAARTERVGTLRKHASGIFLVSISAAMPLSLSKNYPNTPVSGIIKETGVFSWKAGEKMHGMSQSS